MTEYKLKAEKGDLVRIMHGATLDESKLSAGDIVEITHVIENLYGSSRSAIIDFSEYYIKNAYFSDGEPFFLYAQEFELFRKAGEEDEGGRALSLAVPENSEAVQTESDAVNHPSHYTQGRFETIEIIEAITQGYDNGYVAYSIGNALKYLARAPFKHASPIEDLRKAATYLEFAIKAYEAKEAE